MDMTVGAYGMRRWWMPFVWFFGVYFLAASLAPVMGDDPAFAVAVGAALVLYVLIGGAASEPTVSSNPRLYLMAAIVWLVGETATFCQIGETPSTVALPLTLFAYPAFEELVFRGVAYDAWGGDMRPARAAMLTTAVWAALHANIALLPLLIVNGLFLSLVRERTGTVWTGLLIHIAENVLIATPTMIAMVGAAKTAYVVFAVAAVFLGVRIFRELSLR